MANLLFFAFTKVSASNPIYSISSDKLNEDALKLEVIKVIAQLKQITLRPSQRQKINTNNGSWYCKRDEKQIIYLILTNQNYPQRLVYQAINQLIQHLKKLGKNYQSQPDSTLKSHSKAIMQQILTKYQNPKNVDKISQVNNNLDQVRSSVRSSVRKILANQVELQDLQSKAMSLRQHANDFSKSAQDLQRLMYWRNCKIKIIVGIVIISLLCYIIVPIIMRSAGTTSKV